MSNFLNFKFGSFANLPSGRSSGTIYVTTDEQAMYIDLPVKKNNEISVDRMRIGDIVVKESTRTAQPPFHPNSFYYFVEENALLRYDGSKWVQINATDAVNDTITAVNNKLLAEIDRSTAADSQHSEDIEQLKEDIVKYLLKTEFEEYKGLTSQEIEKAQSDASTALENAENADNKAVAAQERADDAYELADSKTTMAEVEAKDYSTKEESQSYANAVLGASNDTSDKNTVYGVKAYAESVHEEASVADGKAVAAQEKADEAYNLADSKVTMAEVEAKDYATKTEAQGYANAVLGTAEDDSNKYTVYGVHELADLALTNAGAANQKAVDANDNANNRIHKDGTVAMTGNLNLGGNLINNLAKPVSNTDAANKQYVDEEIVKGIKANDAMTFRGTIGGAEATVSSLPTENVQRGDTYKVAASYSYGTIEAKVGDLFINSGEDDQEPVWTHISSGYEDTYLQKLYSEGTTIYLTNGVENDKVAGSVSSVTIAGDTNSNLQFSISKDERNNHTVTASLVWGTFPGEDLEV